MRAAVAAGHPATVDAGIEILQEGGNAADAAVAASLASCVAETVMTGLLGGGHAAVAWEGEVRMLDFFVAVPGLGVERREVELVQLRVPFGAELVHYAVGIGSCAVPGVLAGLDELWRAHGSMEWSRLVEPALRLARHGVEMPAAHAACLEMLAPVMTMREGERIYSPEGRLLQTGERLEQPGLVRALELVAEEGGRSASLDHALLELMGERGGLVTATDLRSYKPRWDEPVRAEYAGVTLFSREALNSPLPVLSALTG
jgi:gamma-glutamyltranspeptidase/glutathione hydrolase